MSALVDTVVDGVKNCHTMPTLHKLAEEARQQGHRLYFQASGSWKPGQFLEEQEAEVMEVEDCCEPPGGGREGGREVNGSKSGE